MNAPVVWLGMWLALDAFRHGVTIVGAPGTGKSLFLKVLRLCVARVMGSHPGLRVHLADLDVKGDLYDLYSTFPPDCPVYDIDPFTWSDVYDVVSEIESPLDAAELFALLIDVAANEHQKFFPLSARDVGASLAVRHWLEVPDVATFRDLVLSTASIDGMRLVAASHPTTEYLLSLLSANEVGMGIAASLAVEMNRFKAIAGLYHTNARGRAVTSGSFLRSRRSALRLPMSVGAVHTLAPLTRLFLSRLQHRVLADLVKDRYVLMLIDEASLLPGGIDLLLAGILGRESGLCPVFAFQSYVTTRHLFGKDKLDANLSNNKTFVCFHLPDPEDCAIAAKRFGAFEGLVRGDSASSSRHGASRGWSQTVQPVDNVTPGMIQALKVPGPGYPYLEYYMVSVPNAPFFARVHIPALVGAFWPDAEPVAPPAPRAPRDMVLRPWTEADMRRLKIGPFAP